MNPKFPLELLIWISALVILAFNNPAAHHYTLCPLNQLGFTWCPGCGLGRSISSLLNFDISTSFKHHWFGIPALIILLNRIRQLSQKLLINYSLKLL